MTPKQIDQAIEVLESFKSFCDKTDENNKEKQLQAFRTLISTAEEVKALREDFWYHKGGEDDSYGGKTEPISYKEAYEEGIRYDKDMRKIMQEACNKIKKDPNWTYGENAYPSSHERAIVAGCQKAVKELRAENKKLRLSEEEVFKVIKNSHFIATEGDCYDSRKTKEDWLERDCFRSLAQAICSLQRGKDE